MLICDCFKELPHKYGCFMELPHKYGCFKELPHKYGCFKGLLHRQNLGIVTTVKHVLGLIYGSGSKGNQVAPI